MQRWMTVLLALALAGCASASDETQTMESPGVITDPRDLAASNGTGSHVHDYWGGQASLDLLDASRGSTWNNLGGTFDWRVYFSPPDESVVPQGAARLTVTVDWSYQAPARHGPVSLWVKPADAVEHRFVQVVTSGDTVEVPLAYEEADLPHQLLSAWEFAVQYNSTGAEPSPNVFVGTTHLKVVAHRGLDLRPFPAHPDHWKGRVEFPLLEVSDTFDNVGYTGTGDIPLRYRPADGVLVPGDASYVEVAMTLSPEAPAGAVELYYHAADSRSLTSLGTVSAGQGPAYFEIVVEPGMGDGPYSNASLWEFMVYTPEGESEPAAYRGSFDLTATVHKAG